MFVYKPFISFRWNFGELCTRRGVSIREGVGRGVLGEGICGGGSCLPHFRSMFCLNFKSVDPFILSKLSQKYVCLVWIYINTVKIATARVRMHIICKSQIPLTFTHRYSSKTTRPRVHPSRRWPKAWRGTVRLLKIVTQPADVTQVSCWRSSYLLSRRWPGAKGSVSSPLSYLTLMVWQAARSLLSRRTSLSLDALFDYSLC